MPASASTCPPRAAFQGVKRVTDNKADTLADKKDRSQTKRAKTNALAQRAQKQAVFNHQNSQLDSLV